jgi:hypothetical protein
MTDDEDDDNSDRPTAEASAYRLAWIVVPSALAVALVPFWILWDSAGNASGDFRSTPQFVMWLLVLCAQAAIWVGAAAYAGTTLVRRWSDLRERQALPRDAIRALVVAGVALVGLALLFSFALLVGLFEGVASSRLPSGTDWPLTHHSWKMPPLIAIALVIGTLAIIGMWLTAIAFGDLARHGTATLSSLKRFVELRSELTDLLAVAGALVGLATLASGALREAVVASSDERFYRAKAITCLEDVTGTDEAEVRAGFDELLEAYPACVQVAFDTGYVIAYGLLFTGILALAFTPSLLAMRRAGARLRDSSFPLPAPRDDTFFDTVDRRVKFDALLQTNLSAMTTFKAGVAIVTPLVAGLISTYVPS